MTNQLEEFIEEKSFRWSFFYSNEHLISVDDLREFFKDKVIFTIDDLKDLIGSRAPTGYASREIKEFDDEILFSLLTKSPEG